MLTFPNDIMEEKLCFVFPVPKKMGDFKETVYLCLILAILILFMVQLADFIMVILTSNIDC